MKKTLKENLNTNEYIVRGIKLPVRFMLIEIKIRNNT